MPYVWPAPILIRTVCLKRTIWALIDASCALITWFTVLVFSCEVMAGQLSFSYLAAWKRQLTKQKTPVSKGVKTIVL